MQSILGTRPSYAWRSILGARQVLEQGLIWRVGNGLDIKIWEDRWLSTPISFAMQSPRRILSVDARVAELIDLVTRGWNTLLIGKVFQ
jgi:hypothetical protein